MWAVIRQHLVLKIALVLTCTLAVGFGVPELLNARAQVQEMERLNLRSAESLARGLAAGVRTAMLAGNGLTARAMVEDARKRLDSAELNIYAPTGERVFADKGPAPPPADIPEHVRAAIQTNQSADAPHDATAVPFPNEDRCKSCHPDGTLRAVLTIGTANATQSLDDHTKQLDVLAAISGSAFEQLMTAGKEDGLDAYFEELATRVPEIAGVAVLSSSGDLAFGSKTIAPDPKAAAAIVQAGEPASIATTTGSVRIVPIPNAPQCHACHEPEPKHRGAMVVSLRHEDFEPERTLVTVTDVSLRHVMLAGLGRLIARFLDAIVTTDTVTTLTLHDADGRLFHDAIAKPQPPTLVQTVLAQADAASASTTEGEHEQFTYVVPLLNDEECQRCHGSDQRLRGAIEVVLDTTSSAQSRRQVVRTGLVFGLATIALTLGILVVGLRLLVVRPVAEIGDIADRVGDGKLDARVRVTTSDEIGRLGERLNQMIGELRKKLELAKFVSHATVRSVDANASGVRTSSRRERMTVLFSDVRGFTAYSETVEPEQVVEMLNRYLDAQAQVVERHGGDIDKFVGDELMAHFHGPDMERRAVQCAVEMAEVVAKINDEVPPGTPALGVGIGVNTGDVVFGPMGAASRMDFTVIGDAVNLGARLCSAACPGQVVVSATVRNACADAPGLRFEELAPLSLKGKREPVAVFQARSS